MVAGEGAGDHLQKGGGGGKVGGVLAAPNASFSRLERLGAPGRARGARRRKSVLPPVACDRCLCYRDGFIVQKDMMTAMQQANSSIARPTQKSDAWPPPARRGRHRTRAGGPPVRGFARSFRHFRCSHVVMAAGTPGFLVGCGQSSVHAAPERRCRCL